MGKNCYEKENNTNKNVSIESNILIFFKYNIFMQTYLLLFQKNDLSVFSGLGVKLGLPTFLQKIDFVLCLTFWVSKR